MGGEAENLSKDTGGFLTWWEDGIPMKGLRFLCEAYGKSADEHKRRGWDRTTQLCPLCPVPGGLRLHQSLAGTGL